MKYRVICVHQLQGALLKLLNILHQLKTTVIKNSQPGEDVTLTNQIILLTIRHIAEGALEDVCRKHEADLIHSSPHSA